MAIVESMNTASSDWGIRCLRYEIRIFSLIKIYKFLFYSYRFIYLFVYFSIYFHSFFFTSGDIILPEEIQKTMQMQASAERRKRAQILDSEGARQSDVNIAEGKKQATVLASEAYMLEKKNHALGEAEAIRATAKATAEGIRTVAEAVRAAGGSEAVSYSVAEKYIAAFEKLAKEGTTVLLPSNPSDPASMITQVIFSCPSFSFPFFLSFFFFKKVQKVPKNKYINISTTEQTNKQTI